MNYFYSPLALTVWEVTGYIISIFGIILLFMSLCNFVWAYLQPQYQAIQMMLHQQGSDKSPRLVLLGELLFNSLLAGGFAILVGVAFAPAAPLAFAAGIEYSFRKMRIKAGYEVISISWRLPLVHAIIQLLVGLLLCGGGVFLAEEMR